MLPILIALLVFVLSGFALGYWMRRNQSARAPQPGVERGANQLAKLHWREFAKLVLQAMRGRGYQLAQEEGQPADGIPTDGSDIVMEYRGERILLSCKYGSAAVVGAPALLGLAKSATLRGTEKVIVVTPGRFDQEAARIAQEQKIELIDGESLWPEVRPYVAAPDAPAEVAKPAIGAAPKRQALAWTGAAAIGALAWLFAQSLQPLPESSDLPPSVKMAARHASAPAAQDAEPFAVVPTDPAELEKRRREAANAISTLFGVDRALWSTQSTLLVYLNSEDTDPSNDLCPLLERYPELAASRVQLQPPNGSRKPVRFKQCRSY